MDEEKKEKRGRQGEGGGPKTPEGKARSSMNALKSGLFMTQFQRIGEQAGNLGICNISCDSDQKEQCRAAKTCMLQNELIVNYHLAHSEKNPEHIEKFNVVQLATMDTIFSAKLKYALLNVGQTRIVSILDKKGNVVEEREVEIIDQQYIYMLMNMMQNLNKSLPDMQLTRQTQENIDVEWAKLMQEDIDKDSAEEFKLKILEGMHNWRNAVDDSKKLKSDDQAIQEFIKIEKKSEKSDIGDDAADIDYSNIPHSPFANGNKPD